jgi:hypothetical protein
MALLQQLYGMAAAAQQATGHSNNLFLHPGVFPNNGEYHFFSPFLV